MNNNELNEYIKHYIEADKTHSAIMLTGDWGTGKSYYIQKSLIPYLEEEENGNHKCAVVSLYGLNNLYDLSKALYFEIRLKAFAKMSEAGSTGLFAAKTILKGVTSFFGVDLSKSEAEMQQLYESIDLTGKLIILEDIERSNIDIVELLGYVNNLVEHDDVKVLLVVNEEELIKYEPSTEKGEEVDEQIGELFEKYSKKENRNFTASTKEYLRTKEKTVGDTISYYCDFSTAIKEIITQYSNPVLNSFANESNLKEILHLCEDKGITNLRTFIFACQKTVDIYNRLSTELLEDEDFVKTIFFGIVAFSQRIKKGKTIRWQGEETYSIELGTEHYPWLRFCYDYITRQQFEISRVKEGQKALKLFRFYDQKRMLEDPDIQTLYNLWVSTEKDVRAAVQSISDRLKNPADISYYEYGRLAFHLIVAKNVLDCDIENAKEYLVNNLHHKEKSISIRYLFTQFIPENEKPEILKEYTELKAKMIESIEAKETTIFDFDYDPSNIAEFLNNAEERWGYVFEKRAFVSRLDIDKTIEMLKRCTAQEIQDFRYAFREIYHPSNIGEYFADDREALENLLQMVEGLKEFEHYDMIQNKQIQWFTDDLRDILSRL